MTAVIAKWTLEEYHRLVETGMLNGNHIELIKGEIVETAPEGKPHDYFSEESGKSLSQVLGDRAKVRQGKPITLPDQSEPEPDFAIVQRLGEEYLSHHPYPENIFWVVEYSDASLSKDLEIKTKIYAEVSIPEYWVIALKRRVLIVFREPTMGNYTSRQEYSAGNISPVAFPDLCIPVSTIVR